MAEIKVNGVSLSQIEDEALLAKLVTIHNSFASHPQESNYNYN